MEVLNGGLVGGIERKGRPVVLLGFGSVPLDLHQSTQKIKGLRSLGIDKDRFPHVLGSSIELSVSYALEG